MPWSTKCASCLKSPLHIYRESPLQGESGLLVAAGPCVDPFVSHTSLGSKHTHRRSVEVTSHPIHCPDQPEHQIRAQQDKVKICLFKVSPWLGSHGNQLPSGGVPLQQASPHTSAPATHWTSQSALGYSWINLLEGQSWCKYFSPPQKEVGSGSWQGQHGSSPSAVPCSSSSPVPTKLWFCHQLAEVISISISTCVEPYKGLEETWTLSGTTSNPTVPIQCLAHLS